MRLTMLAVVAFCAYLLAERATAQPAATFQARCSELRDSMKALDGREEREIVTIEVVGEIQIVREQDGLVFLGLCGPPDPRVLCITYEANGRQVGDRVLVVGGIHPAGEDFIQLDPCLHHTPTAEDKN